MKLAWTKPDEIEINMAFLADMMRHAIAMLFKHDMFLLQNGRMENAVVCRIAHYCQCFLDDKLEGDGTIVVDAHYNKHLDDPKFIPGTSGDRGKEIDLVLHERGSDIRNLLACEIKAARRGKVLDRQKLIGLTLDKKAGGNYGYRYGLFLRFGIKNHAGKIEDEDWFEHGSRKLFVSNGIKDNLRLGITGP